MGKTKEYHCQCPNCGEDHIVTKSDIDMWHDRRTTKADLEDMGILEIKLPKDNGSITKPSEGKEK